MKAREEDEDFRFAALIGTLSPFSLFETLSLWRKPSPHFVSVLQHFAHADRMFWLGGLLIPCWGQHFTLKVTISIIVIAQRRDTRCNRVQLERNISDFYVPRHDWGDLMFSYMSLRFPRGWICDWNGHLINNKANFGALLEKKINDLKIKPLLSLVSDTCVRWFAFVTVLEKKESMICVHRCN